MVGILKRQIFAPCVMICLLEKHAFKFESQKIAAFSGFALTFLYSLYDGIFAATYVPIFDQTKDISCLLHV